MSIVLLEGFELKVNSDLSSLEAMEKGIESIGCLASVAADCANVNAALSDGSIPNDLMVRNLVYAATILTSLVNEVAGELELIGREIAK